MTIEAAQKARNVSQMFWTQGPKAVRDMINARITALEGLQSGVKDIQPLSISYAGRETPLQVYRPLQDRKASPIFFLHGGAWVIRAHGHDNLARYLCAETGRIVVSVDYCNALDSEQQGRFPGPLEQSYDALLWTQDNLMQDHSGDGIILVGDSAGANMSSGLCLMSHDRQGPKIRAQVLINTAPDLTGDGTLERQDDTQTLITAENGAEIARTAWRDLVRWYARQYLAPQDKDARNHPYASPILGDPTHFPDTFCVLNEDDHPIYEDALAFIERLKQAGVHVTSYSQPGGHLGPSTAKVAEAARPALQAAVDYIHQLSS